MLLQLPNSFFGLNFTELLAFLALLGGIVTAYTSLNVRIANLEVNQKHFECERKEILDTIETNRLESNSLIETIRKENRQDHGKIFSALSEYNKNQQS